jgi:hypothetical protein
LAIDILADTANLRLTVRSIAKNQLKNTAQAEDRFWEYIEFCAVTLGVRAALICHKQIKGNTQLT